MADWEVADEKPMRAGSGGGEWDVASEIPMRGVGRQALDAVNSGVNWLGTRVTNAATNVLDAIPIGQAASIAARTAASPTGEPAPASRIAPSTQDARDFIYRDMGVPEVNLPGTAGKIVDAGTEALVAAPFFPGPIQRTAFPAFGGGAASEAAGHIPGIKGTKAEPVARLVGGVVGGATAAGLQEAGRAAWQAARNTFGAVEPTPTAAGIIVRDLGRDKMTPEQLAAARAALGDDAFLVDAGGANVRGALRGSTALRGPARDMVDEAFVTRAGNEGARLNAATDRALSPNTLTSTVDDLVQQRNTAPRPLYEKALNVDQVWSPRVQQFLDDPLVKPGISRGLEIQRLEALARGEKFDPLSYGITAFADDGAPIITGTPNMRLLDAAKKGIDAMIDDYRNPMTGRVILDERGRALEAVRKAYLGELDSLNPDYSAARAAYAGPSQLKDAAEMGARLFSANARPEVVQREFARLSPDQQNAFLVGVAEHMRKSLGASDATNKAARMVRGSDAVERLRAILPPDRFDQFMGAVAREKGFTQTMRDVNAGSRTAPMLADASENATAAAGGLARDAIGGNYLGAAMRIAGAGLGRVAQGRTEKVNAEVARLLLAPPEEQAAVINALNAAMLSQRTGRANIRNAFRAGALSPGANAVQDLGR